MRALEILKGEKMIRNGFSKIFFISIFIIFFFAVSIESNIWSATLTLEICSDNEVKQIVFKPEEIEKVGINDTLGETRVEITIATKYHALLEKLTKENRGKRIVIRTETATLFSGTILDPIIGRMISLPCLSEKDARAMITKMGREPSYHLKFTPEELESAKIYTEPAKNLWAAKAIYAITDQNFEKAEKFAKKAISSAPNEPSYHELLSTIYYNQGKKKLALKEALTAERLNKKDDLQRFPGTYLSIADLYAKLNEYEKAIEYFQKVLSVYENNLLAHLGLAETYESMGKTDFAFKEYLVLSESDDEDFQEKGLEGIKRLQSK